VPSSEHFCPGNSLSAHAPAVEPLWCCAALVTRMGRMGWRGRRGLMSGSLRRGIVSRRGRASSSSNSANLILWNCVFPWNGLRTPRCRRCAIALNSASQPTSNARSPSNTGNSLRIVPTQLNSRPATAVTRWTSVFCTPEQQLRPTIRSAHS